MSVYGDVIHDHSRHPRNYGSLDAPDLRAEGHNPFCGDRVRIEVALDSDGTVREARFQGDLCVIAKAAASLLTEQIVGRPLRSGPGETEFLAALGAEIRPARRTCALLAFETLRQAMEEDRR